MKGNRMIHGNAARLLLAALAIGSGQSARAADAPVPKAYVVAEINVKDVAGYRGYTSAAFPIIQKYGGRFLTRGGQTIAVEGAAPAQRVMIIEFDSLEQARKFEYSKEYTAIAPLRQKTAESRLFIVEGAPDPAASKP
jgi:uncharacterized protein (DUF1330 family)